MASPGGKLSPVRTLVTDEEFGQDSHCFYGV